MLSSLHRSVFLVLSSLVPLLQTNIIKASDSFDESVGGFFESHCNRCHDDKKQKGDFRLDELSRNFTKGEDSELWFEVMDWYCRILSKYGITGIVLKYNTCSISFSVG